MRQQLSLFPEKLEIPRLICLESSVSQNEDTLRLDPEIEKTLDPAIRYHDEYLRLNNTCSSRIGDWAEHKVQSIALSLGLEVYENISCVGLADLVINSNNSLYMIDVKIAERQKKQGRLVWCQSSGVRRNQGVYGVCLIPASNGIYCRWYNRQQGSRLIPVHPPGLKNLWPAQASLDYKKFS